MSMAGCSAAREIERQEEGIEGRNKGAQAWGGMECVVTRVALGGVVWGDNSSG